MLSVGAIRFEHRFCTSKKVGQGEVGRFQHGVPYTWQLLWLLVKKRWSAPAWPFLFLTQTGLDKAHLSLYRGSISGIVGSFQSGEAFTGWRALTIVSSLMSKRGRGHEP